MNTNFISNPFIGETLLYLTKFNYTVIEVTKQIDTDTDGALETIMMCYESVVPATGSC